MFGKMSTKNNHELYRQYMIAEMIVNMVCFRKKSHQDLFFRIVRFK